LGVCTKETGDWRLETGDWRLETGDWRLETGDWRPETGGGSKGDRKMKKSTILQISHI